MSVTIAKDHVQVVFGKYILGLRVGGVRLAYPSLARKPPVARLKAGSKAPPKRELRGPREAIVPGGSVKELGSLKWEDTVIVRPPDGGFWRFISQVRAT